jgi:hypothetical protein
MIASSITKHYRIRNDRLLNLWEKQVGAVTFSLAFWTASTLVYDNRIRKSVLISAIGIAILFGTFEIALRSIMSIHHMAL